MENFNACLLNKSCVPCQGGGVSPMTLKDANKLLKKLGQEWSINVAGHLYKEYKLSVFMSAMNLANKIAELAEREAHHPNLIISWGMCAIEIWTHKINGLSESDFILAAKIDSIAH